MAKRIGKRTLALESRPGVLAYASVVGGKEGAGPLKKGFDEVSLDSYFGQDTWEKAEMTMLTRCLDRCAQKSGGLRPDAILGGDLLNQCVSSAFAVKDRSTPYLGLYGACSTMAEGLSLAARGSTASRWSTGASAPRPPSGRSPGRGRGCLRGRAARSNLPM